jgi:pimeloyl-ACP methyl ester carboxylesterase
MTSLHEAATEGSIYVPDGRRLTYRAIGPASGHPLFFFHGWGQSRLTAHPDDTIVESMNIRLITIDRPGTGLSDPQPRRTLLDWPQDVLALANRLDLGRFSVLGYSAGAAYVASCVSRLSDRLSSATIVSGVSPPSIRITRALLASEFWHLGLFVAFARRLARPVLWTGVRYMKPRIEELFDRHLERLSESDRDVMRDPRIREMRVNSMLEALRQGEEGIYEDAMLLVRAWKIDLRSIKFPIRIWHGESDRIIDMAFGCELRRQLPNAITTFLPGLGHYMIFSHWGDILKAIQEDVGNGQAMLA